MQHHVFLSYSRKDSPVMEQVRQALRDAGLSVWTDEGIEPGTPLWKDSIEEAIENAACMVVLLSPDAKKSIWVKRELEYAGVQRLAIFPVMVRGEENNAIPFALIGAQFIDIRSNYENHIQRLITTIQKRLNLAKPSSKLDSVPHSTLSPSGKLSVQVIRNSLPQLYPNAKELLLKTVSLLPPPFEWCEVPSGEVTLKSGEGKHRTPITDTLAAFYIAKYPITNAQFEVFVSSTDGYANPRWWDYSADAQAWRNVNMQPSETPFDGDNRPRVYITWYEAMAFCKWLSAQTIEHLPLQISLPTEKQWQRAAQGDDKREYPWGNEFDASRCNTMASDLGGTTSVTKYPNGASPYDVMDMAGNVWEWCLTTWEGGENISDSGDIARVLRGGSWYHLVYDARTVSRMARKPYDRGGSAGFRLVAAATL